MKLFLFVSKGNFYSFEMLMRRKKIFLVTLLKDPMQKALDCEYQLVVLDASLSNEKLSQIEIFSAYIEF